MSGMPALKPLRTRVYIDGYNLYYGCLKGTSYKWLDLQMLFEKHILPSSSLPQTNSVLLPLSIKFFTAKIIERAARSADSVSSQARYHTALRKLYDGRIQLIEGYYSITESKVRIIDPKKPDAWLNDCQEALAWKLEEKQSDVNLALQAYHDAITKEVDQVVIVTNDTDIAPAVDLIRKHTNVIVGLVVPARNSIRIPNTELAALAHWVRKNILVSELAASQLPRVVQGGKNPTSKPESWYARPDLLEKVLTLATPILGGRNKVFKWMEVPNDFMDKHAPINLIETDEGAERVIQYIERYKEDQIYKNNNN